MKFLKDLLDAECTYRLPDDVMWRFIGLMTREEVRKGETIIDEGRVNPDIYILAEGIFSYNYLNGTDERCHAFALPGTMMFGLFILCQRTGGLHLSGMLRFGSLSLPGARF